MNSREVYNTAAQFRFTSHTHTHSQRVNELLIPLASSKLQLFTHREHCTFVLLYFSLRLPESHWLSVMYPNYVLHPLLHNFQSYRVILRFTDWVFFTYSIVVSLQRRCKVLNHCITGVPLQECVTEREHSGPCYLTLTL